MHNTRAATHTYDDSLLSIVLYQYNCTSVNQGCLMHATHALCMSLRPHVCHPCLVYATHASCMQAMPHVCHSWLIYVTQASYMPPRPHIYHPGIIYATHASYMHATHASYMPSMPLMLEYVNLAACIIVSLDGNIGCIDYYCCEVACATLVPNGDSLNPCVEICQCVRV